MAALLKTSNSVHGKIEIYKGKVGKNLSKTRATYSVKLCETACSIFYFATKEDLNWWLNNCGATAI